MPTLPRDTGWLLIVVYVFGLVLLMTVGLRDGGMAETPFLLVVAVADSTQFVASVEKETVPASPTATKRPFVYTAPDRLCGSGRGFPFGSGLRQVQWSRPWANAA